MTDRKQQDNKEKAKVVVKATDMPEDMKKDATQICGLVIDKYSNQKGTHAAADLHTIRTVTLEMAEQIKKFFDKRYLGGWHCIVGRGFGIYVTHEQGTFIRLVKGHLQVLLYRCSG